MTVEMVLMRRTDLLPTHRFPALGLLALMPAIFLVPVDGFGWGCWTYVDHPCHDSVGVHVDLVKILAILAIIYRFFEAIIPSKGKRPRLARLGGAFVQLFTSPVTFLKSQFGHFKFWKWLLAVVLLILFVEHDAFKLEDSLRTNPCLPPTETVEEWPR